MGAALPANAQLGVFGGPDDGPVTMTARAGFDNTRAAQRWTPLYVTISSPDTFQGVLSIEYSQDAVQLARLMAPVAVQGGVPTPAIVPISPSIRAGEITVTLLDADRGSPVAKLVLDDRDADHAVPRARHVNDRRVLAVGVPELVRALPKPPVDLSIFDQPERRWLMVDSAVNRTVAVAPPDAGPQRGLLPRQWMGYDDFAAVVIDLAANPLDQGVEFAIAQWTRGGGHLVLIADGPGAELEFWLRRLGIQDPPVRLGPPTRGTLSRDPTYTGTLPARWNSDAPFRQLTLTPSGEADGWSATFLTQSSELIATGPVGLGMLTVCSIHPARMPDSPAPEDAAQLWSWITTGWTGVEIFDEEGEDNRWFDMTQMYGVGNDELRQAADETIGAPRISDVPFFVLAAASLVLALLVGPVDMFALKRLGRSSQSWITALIWIGIAGAVGLIVPSLTRSSESVFGRVTVVDAVCDPASSEAWASGIAGFFTGTRGRVELDYQAAQSNAAPAGPIATRGYSAIVDHFYSRSAGTNELDLVAAPQGVLSPSIPSATWSARFLHEEAPIQPRIIAQRDGDAVRISGIEHADGVRAAIREAGSERFYSLRVEAESSGMLLSSQGLMNSTLGGGYPTEPGRDASIDARLASGDWDLIVISVPEVYPGSAAPRTDRGPFALNHTIQGRTVYRLLIPSRQQQNEDQP